MAAGAWQRRRVPGGSDMPAAGAGRGKRRGRGVGGTGPASGCGARPSSQLPPLSALAGSAFGRQVAGMSSAACGPAGGPAGSRPGGGKAGASSSIDLGNGGSSSSNGGMLVQLDAGSSARVSDPRTFFALPSAAVSGIGRHAESCSCPV